MSRYFDEVREQVRCLQEALSAGDLGVADKIDLLWHRVEKEVCLCAELPGFPADLRVSVALVLLRHLPEPLPHVVRDYEDEADILRGLLDLERDLHDVFHDVGRRKIPGFTDDPLVPVTNALDNARDFRESLAPLLPEFKWVAEGAKRSRGGEL